jgi:Flp pilus assembly protein TadD
MIRERFLKNNPLDFRWEVLICLFLVVALYGVYGQVGGHSFVRYDDGLYVTANYEVQNGLNLHGINWALTTTHAYNWHPLTWMSHMLDVSLFGLEPGAHHVVNLYIHLANSLLLFFVFRRMSAEVWQSGFVAVLFALHPLHVESVAWVSERKDVLSTLFWMLTMWSYTRYTVKTDAGWYLLTLLFFMLGLMTKPMMVTLPFVLLLLDYWPLRRYNFKGFNRITPLYENASLVELIREKIPFFFLSTASCMVTFYAQKTGGSLGSSDVYPLATRISNALIAYVSYIGKTFWPFSLAVFYPYPQSIPIWQAVGAGLLLMAAFGLVVINIRRFPYLAVGWFWYFGTLVPVIGLVQVGGQAMADRYTYIPLIGVFVILAWGIPHVLSRWRFKTIGMIFGASVILLVCTMAARFQTSIWADSHTLFEHALKVTENNAVAHNIIAYSLAEKGELKEAARHIYAGLEIQPANFGAYNNLGNIRLQQGKVDEAVRHFSKALQINPDKEYIHYNLANALMAQGKTADAIAHYDLALGLTPNNVNYRNNLANALVKAGRIADALHHYQAALSIDPNDPEILNNCGVALIQAGKIRAAVKCFKMASSLDPEYAIAKNNLLKALAKQTKE